jgi:FAD/FMN-containing dehydrogenase
MVPGPAVTPAADEADFADLAARVGDRLVRVEAPLAACLADGSSPGCAAALARLRNPFAIQDHPGAFHAAGWHGAWAAGHSPRAVAAESAADIAAAVQFARARGIGLVIKGTGHDYLGRSCAPGSLLIWTHRMRDITVHDAFTPAGTGEPGVPAISVGAGTRWLEAYQALAGTGRYVQGGGCTSVGAAGGFTQGGGFGHFSRRYGTAAGNVLEAEVVTASGEIVVASAARHPDLFWALRGGGGGTFGVVSRVTMRTHPAPRTMTLVTGTIKAAGDEDFRRLAGGLVRFLPALCDDHWGEQVMLSPRNEAEVFMAAADVPAARAQEIWQPLLSLADEDPGGLACDVSIATFPFASFWDPAAWDAARPDMIRRDDRPGEPPGRYWWAADDWQVSQYLHAYQSRWLPHRLFTESPDALAGALFAASRQWPVSLNLNKALRGAAPDAVARDRGTCINPAVFDAAALLVASSWQPHAFPGVPGHEPDTGLAAASAGQVGQAMQVIRALTPGSGSYVNETDYFEPDWQESFWGANYPRLLEIKRAYDPANIFRVHHGVGSEAPGP